MITELARDEPLSQEPASGTQAWLDDYPWLRQALTEIGPGARGASASWRARIEDELKTTLDFKVRPDGTAVVWCGMSGYDFHHDPTPKELFEGLGEAYRQEIERVGGGNPWKMSRAHPGPRERPRPQTQAGTLRPPTADSTTSTVAAVFLPRLAQLVLIFLAVTVLTVVLSSVAESVR